MKIRRAFVLELAAALLVSILGAYMTARFSGKFNRTNQAAERIAAALERAFPAERRLPRPSLLGQVEIKPIPEPNPDPCVTEAVYHPEKCE